MKDRLLDYRNKCNVLKSIQSIRASRYRRLNIFFCIITISVSALITFIGFSGIDAIQRVIKGLLKLEDLNMDIIQFAFNFLVFLLFIATLVPMIFQFSSKQSESEKAISSLAILLNDIDDILTGNFGIDEKEVERITYKYKVISQTLPANSDRLYRKAKSKLAIKEQQKILEGRFDLKNEFTEDKLKVCVQELVLNNKEICAILDVLNKQEEILYLGGGVIRNLVWDYLHGFENATAFDDIDVIYFNSVSKEEVYDEKLEKILLKEIPNLKWDVKNQARMHEINSDEPYADLNDAISKWPETSSAILLRKTEKNKFEWVIPFGLKDLFRLIVKPTPHFLSKLNKYKARLKKKNWKEIWYNLDILYE